MAKSKGWHPAEVAKHEYLEKLAAQKKSPVSKSFDKSMFWIALLITVLEIVLVPVVLIPLILATKAWLYITVAILLGLIFGYFLVFLTEKEDLKHHHHIAAITTIIVFAVLTAYIAAWYANWLIQTIPLSTPSASPLLVSILFAVSFLIPYIYKILK